MRMEALASAKAEWRSAMRWRRAVEEELAGIGLGFTEWLVLDSADELIRETQDAVSQNAIAARAELEKMTVSLVARKLERRGLLSRAPSYGGRPSLRIFLTQKGERLAEEARTRAELVSLAGEGSPGAVRRDAS